MVRFLNGWGSDLSYLESMTRGYLIEVDCSLVNLKPTKLKDKDDILNALSFYTTLPKIERLMHQVFNLSGHHLSGHQTRANNSTLYCYSKITQKSAIIWGQILGRIRVNDSTQVIFESLLGKSAFTICAFYLADFLMHALILLEDNFWIPIVFSTISNHRLK